MESKTYNKPVNVKKKKETHRWKELTSGYYGGGEGQYRGAGMEVQMLGVRQTQ